MYLLSFQNLYFWSKSFFCFRSKSFWKQKWEGIFYKTAISNSSWCPNVHIILCCLWTMLIRGADACLFQSKHLFFTEHLHLSQPLHYVISTNATWHSWHVVSPTDHTCLLALTADKYPWEDNCLLQIDLHNIIQNWSTSYLSGDASLQIHRGLTCPLHRWTIHLDFSLRNCRWSAVMAQCSHNRHIRRFCKFPRAAPGSEQAELSSLLVIYCNSWFGEVCISVRSLFRKATN